VYLGVGNLTGLEPLKQQARGQGAPHVSVARSAGSHAGASGAAAWNRVRVTARGVMLARSYSAIGRWGDAAAAFAKAEALFPQDAQLLAD